MAQARDRQSDGQAVTHKWLPKGGLLNANNVNIYTNDLSLLLY